MKKLILILSLLLFSTQCFAEFQALIKVPESLVKTNLPVAVVEIMAATNSAFTDDPAWNTRVYNNYKLINFKGNTTYPRLQLFIASVGLDWEILCANDGWKDINIEIDGIMTKQKVINTLLGYDPAILINYIARKRIYNIDETYTETIPDKIEFGRFGGMPILQPKE